jgi:hypothetical protein
MIAVYNLFVVSQQAGGVIDVPLQTAEFPKSDITFHFEQHLPQRRKPFPIVHRSAPALLSQFKIRASMYQVKPVPAILTLTKSRFEPNSLKLSREAPCQTGKDI